MIRFRNFSGKKTQTIIRRPRDAGAGRRNRRERDRRRPDEIYRAIPPVTRGLSIPPRYGASRVTQIAISSGGRARSRFDRGKVCARELARMKRRTWLSA